MRRRIGAIIVVDNFIVSTGYNGAPSGLAHCEDLPEGCLRNKEGIKSGTMQERCRAVHAEQNAIVQAAARGTGAVRGGTMYCSLQPCVLCARLMLNAGIKRVVYQEAYPDKQGIEMLHEGDVSLMMMTHEGYVVNVTVEMDNDLWNIRWDSRILQWVPKTHPGEKK